MLLNPDKNVKMTYLDFTLRCHQLNGCSEGIINGTMILPHMSARRDPDVSQISHLTNSDATIRQIVLAFWWRKQEEEVSRPPLVVHCDTIWDLRGQGNGLCVNQRLGPVCV